MRPRLRPTGRGGSTLAERSSVAACVASNRRTTTCREVTLESLGSLGVGEAIPAQRVESIPRRILGRRSYLFAGARRVFGGGGATSSTVLHREQLSLLKLLNLKDECGGESGIRPPSRSALRRDLILSASHPAVARADVRRERRRMAERVGFEPTVEFPLHTLSKRAPSTTRTSLRIFRISSLQASG